MLICRLSTFPNARALGIFWESNNRPPIVTNFDLFARFTKLPFNFQLSNDLKAHLRLPISSLQFSIFRYRFLECRYRSHKFAPMILLTHSLTHFQL